MAQGNGNLVRLMSDIKNKVQLVKKSPETDLKTTQHVDAMDKCANGAT